MATAFDLRGRNPEGGGGSVGRSVGRADGDAKVRGTALYVDDLPPRPGEIHGATVRSAVPRGRILGITLDPAFDWSDVTVVTAADLSGGLAHNIVATIVDDQPILAADCINHQYEPIALVACADPRKLARAVEAVKVDVEPLRAVLDAEESLRSDTVIWGEDNCQKKYLIEKGLQGGEGQPALDIDDVLASCAVVVSGRYSTHHQEQLYIETQGIIAWWDAEGAHAIGSIQCPYYVHKAFLKAFDLPAEQIHITQAVTGGGFGGKEEYPSVIALHAALLSKKSGRPVRMIYGRKEDIEATTKRHPCICEITSGCDADGNLIALKMHVLMDGGAYVTLTPVVLSRGILHAAGCYQWKHAQLSAVAVATNTPPNGAFRGFGAPQTIWAIERHMDKIAERLARDPLELKRQNVLKEGDSTATGQVLRTSVAGLECLDKARAASNWDARRGAIERANAERLARGERKVRGLGASVFMHGAGFTGSGERFLKGKVAVDLLPGGRLGIRTASTDIGQGTETVFRQIAADAAGVGMADVDFAQPSTTVVPDSGPTVASRTVMVVGSIVERAATAVAEQVRAEMQSGGGGFVEAADRLLARGPVTSLLTYEPPDWVKWDDVTYKGDAYPCFGWGCDIAEVEVDLDTFEVTVPEFWTIVDVGKAINPVMCKGQLEGGALQAIGWALWEDVTWRDGAITNPRMTNYIVPTALDAPPFHTILVECPFAYGPGGGAKGIGELPMDGGAPAVAAAIEHATGLFASSLPLTPERLLDLELARQASSVPYSQRTK